jgi:glycosyltransferase involved in cell wall biosynthesis
LSPSDTEENKHLNYVLITSAHDEAQYIEKTIQSVVSQIVLPLRWIIVNDGSHDRTPEIIDRYTRDYDWIQRLDMPSHGKRSFAAKAHCFNRGYQSLRHLEFEIIGNLDADISFANDFMEFLLAKFAETPELGVAGTIFREEGYDSGQDSFEGEKHVSGQCQLFRRKCLEQIGGYVPNHAGGVDWIAVTSARMKGWKTRSFREKFFFHYRKLGTGGRNRLSAIFSYGEKDYYLGNHPLWEITRVGYRLGKKPLFTGGIALAAGYFWAALRRIDRPVSRELMLFHRKEEMKKLRAIASAAMHLHKIDNFSLMSERRR